MYESDMSATSSSKPPAKVDVCSWSLDVPDEEFEELAAFLNLDEKARAAGFFNRTHARHWTACRGRVRQLLGRETGISPADIEFAEEEFGRPFLVPDSPSVPLFNLSHTDGLAALAISYDVRVGVDIETIQPLRDDEMEWPLSPAERETLGKAPEAERHDVFFRFWTLKEAFIKAVGKGVSLPLEDFDMSGPDDGQPRLLRLAGEPREPEHWKFSEHRLRSDTFAAVAARVNSGELVVNWHPLGQFPNPV